MIDVVVFERFELDVRRRRLRKAGRSIRIQPQPLALLIMLVSRPGVTVTRAELQAALWPHGTHVEFDMALNTAVRKVRRALGDSAIRPRFVQTIPGIGYRFIGSLSEPRPQSQPESPSAGVSRVPGPILAPHAGSRINGARTPRVAAMLALAMVVMTTVPASPSMRSPALESLVRGVRAIGEDPASLRRAHASFEMAVGADPRSAAAWAWWALTRARLAFLEDRSDAHSFALARAAAERALALDPRHWTAHAALAYVAAGWQGDKQSARRFFELALARGAVDARTFVDYACVLKDLGRPELSLTAIDTALAREPASSVLHAYRGLYLHAVRRYDEEMPALLEAVALDPFSAEAHLHLGLGYARRQQYADAITSLQTAASLSHGSPHIRDWLARITTEASTTSRARARG